jgi:sugar fermentation stimulation protein A
MKFSKRLIKGKLIKRYKRFFADINIKNEIITAHCPNTGSMMGLLDQNNEVWISKNNNPKRKLKYTLEIIKTKDNLVGVNTHLANKIVYEGLSNNLINEFMNSDSIKPEVYYNKNTRFDFLVNKNNQNHFIEVKNVTLFRTNNVAEFPDAVTSRGSKHIKTLVDAIKKGYKSYVLFLVQIQNIENFQIAKDIDKIYYENYLLAKKDGVQFLAYRCNIDTNSITIEKKLNIINE